MPVTIWVSTTIRGVHSLRITKFVYSTGEKAHLFTGALYNNYGPPPGFCFDILCSDEPIIDAKWSPDNNVERRVNIQIDIRLREPAI